MIPGLDSATPPNAAALSAARAAGYRIWSGYISTAPYDGGSHFMLWHPWPKSAFDACQALGSTPIAYASGLDNPATLKALAASWGVRLCLDVESGIRGDGSWVQPWLDASGAGLYGNAPVHNGRRAAFHILAGYPGYDPKSTWPNWVTRPVGPVAWQWQGTHTEFGVGVDSCWFDDAFAGLHGGGAGQVLGEEMDPHMLAQIMYLAGLGRVYGNNPDGSAEGQWLVDLIVKDPSDVGATLGAVVNSPEGKAWSAKLAQLRSGTVGAQGSKGDPGPAGPPGPQGPTGPAGVQVNAVPHHHVTASLTVPDVTGPMIPD